MGLYNKSLDDLTEDDLLDLIRHPVQEGRAIDYKLQLPGNAESERRELRFDVSSFANADGGHMVFGMEEKNGVAAALPGLHGINPDAEIQRLDSIIQTFIDPRTPGVRFRPVQLANGGLVIVGLIPRSSVGPHLVIVDDNKRFYSRNSAGKYLMSGAEIRAAFTSAGLMAAIRIELEATLARLLFKAQHKLTAQELEPTLKRFVEGLPEPEREDALQSMTVAMAGKDVDVPIARHRFLTPLVETTELQTDPSESISLDRMQQYYLVNYLLAGVVDPREIRTHAVRQVTAVGALLAYDPTSQTLQNSELSAAISDLIEEAESYASRYEMLAPRRATLLAELTSARRNRRAAFELSMVDAVKVWSVYCSQVRLYARVAALYRYITGWRSSPAPDSDQLISANPFGPEEEKKVERELVTPADVQRWTAIMGGPWEI